MSELDTDKMETCEGAVIQHGPLNNRIYLMKMGDGVPRHILPAVNALVEKQGYTKVFAKIPAGSVDEFCQQGYRIEARIPAFYDGIEDAVFLGKYHSEERAVAANQQDLDGIVQLAKSRMSDSFALKPLFEGASIRRCVSDDVNAMAEIYKQVFPTYPFPIDKPQYLQETMESHIDYYGVEFEGKLVALSSAEMDKDGRNVEMTDFATLPDWRGRSIACHLLREMERGMREQNMHMAYTIARAVSPGMNITFAKMGYEFGGQLTNNTNISGCIESMNVWYKPLNV